METDPQFYELLQDCPELRTFLLGRELKDYQYESTTLKSSERRLDGYLFTTDRDEPNYVVEVQGKKDETIYDRTIQQMAYLRLNRRKDIHSVIIFLKKQYDTRTQPWYTLVEAGRNELKVLYLKSIYEELEERDPHHPFVALLRPLFIKDLGQLKALGPQSRKDIENSNLADTSKKVVHDVLINWFMARFETSTEKEILDMFEMMTPLEETVSGKELIAKGEKRGLAKGEKRGLAKGEKRGLAKGEKLGLTKAERVFQRMLQEGSISPEKYQQALQALSEE